jgi:hypothetical protein
MLQALFGAFVMAVITVNRYNVLNKIVTACFETRKAEPLAAVDTSAEFYVA